MEQMLLLPEEEAAWLLPERRKASLARALEAWELGDHRGILQGFRVYLARVEGKAATTTELHLGQAERFLRFLEGLERKPMAWERGDFLRLVQELKAEGLSDSSILRYFFGTKAFLRFLEWAGASPPPLDLQRPSVVFRRSQPYTAEELRDMVKEGRELPSRWRHTYTALLVLMGEVGLRLGESLSLTLDEVEVGGKRARVKAPGGWVELSPLGSRVMEEYLAWRKKTALPGLHPLLVSPKGRPLSPATLPDLRRVVAEFLDREFNTHALRLTGQARLVREYGPRRARSLLRRALV